MLQGLLDRSGFSPASDVFAPVQKSSTGPVRRTRFRLGPNVPIYSQIAKVNVGEAGSSILMRNAKKSPPNRIPSNSRWCRLRSLDASQMEPCTVFNACQDWNRGRKVGVHPPITLSQVTSHNFCPALLCFREMPSTRHCGSELSDEGFAWLIRAWISQ